MRGNIFENQMAKMKQSSNIIKRLIIINVIFFIVVNIIVSYYISQGKDPSGFLNNVESSSRVSTLFSKPWTMVTNMFMHLDFMHILFNMLYLWWFGKILQESYGGQSVLKAYILGGVTCNLFFIIFCNITYPGIDIHALGASGGVMAIMVASAVVNPEKKINLFIIGAVRLKWIVLTLFILSSVINFHENIGGKIGHFGGAAFGLLFAYNLKNGKNIAAWFDRFMNFLSRLFRIKSASSINGKSYAFRGAMDRRPKEMRDLTQKNFVTKAEAKREMDKLLDKVKKKGYKNLSLSEKARMKDLSKHYE